MQIQGNSFIITVNTWREDIELNLGYGITTCYYANTKFRQFVSW